MTSYSITRKADAPSSQEYGCRFTRYLPWGNPQPSDNGAAVSVIAPGEQSLAHEHDEHEFFYVCSGAGLFWAQDRSEMIQAGDAIWVQPGTRHHFENTSSAATLEVFSVWSTESKGAEA
ncbi:cupin domain-containing protein [Pseudomonas sp. HS6]|uniref:cupin domain-containing protein n=1 Tax=Pseudomonas sp. HS6 TaxID=2850559 RepID=UPI0020185B0F|nr:cupin domain-containing protein [Pseudomonas sp. HS6]UQS17174.1 cupin domain-containing protein [Pseudomonas sp. HS6]